MTSETKAFCSWYNFGFLMYKSALDRPTDRYILACIVRYSHMQDLHCRNHKETIDFKTGYTFRYNGIVYQDSVFYHGYQSLFFIPYTSGIKSFASF